MATTVTKQDPRFAVLKRSRNQRWPVNEAETVNQIDICVSAEDTATALQRIVSAGMRPTVRSGGHCYEDFVVNNPGGSIIDLSLATPPQPPGGDTRYWVPAGKQLGDIYQDLYKRHGLTIPAGTCYTVGAGGHIGGGGYGLLSRLHGLTVDWISAVDILTVDAKGKVISRRVDAKTDPDLFRACRGAGGGNFGIITGFLFDKLPPAPQEVVSASLSFDWATMTESRFVNILTTYGNYWATRGKDRDTWGMFTIMAMSHSSAKTFGMSVQFCNPDGTCGDLAPLNEFLDLFQPCKPTSGIPLTPAERAVPQPDPKAPPCTAGQYSMLRRLWLDATVGRGGGGGGGGGGGNANGPGTGRAKYKSAYMKKSFTEDEARCYYKHLTRNIPGVDLRGSIVAVDSYGGATNQPQLADTTSIWQRSSIMKLQYQSYWGRKDDDAKRLQWMTDIFSEVYSAPRVDSRYAGTPYPGEYYEGCYINYPDSDMLAHAHWPQLYYGDTGMYPFLQGVKRKYDPNNIFHHSMSVRP